MDSDQEVVNKEGSLFSQAYLTNLNKAMDGKPKKDLAAIQVPLTLDAVYVYEVPWSEFHIVPSHSHACSAMVGVPHRPLLPSLPREGDLGAGLENACPARRVGAVRQAERVPRPSHKIHLQQ